MVVKYTFSGSYPVNAPVVGPAYCAVPFFRNTKAKTVVVRSGGLT